MPQSPPPEIPVRSYPTPQIVDGLLVEEVDSRKADYRALQPGEVHPDTVNYSGFIHVLTRPSRAERFVQRIYVNDRSNQNTYNASIGFEQEANSYPNYIRTYLVRRDSYTPATKLGALSGIVSVQVTAGGSNYTTAPTVTLGGATGSGATATAIIFRGAVVGVIITAEGTNYTTPLTVSFSGGGGTGATATASIQPATAKLTQEKAERLEGDPVDSLYLRLTRVYETLPGPPIAEKFLTDKGELATKTTTKQVSGTGPDADALLTLDSKTNARDSNVEFKETITIPAHEETEEHELYYGNLLRTTRKDVAAGTKPTTGDGIVEWTIQDYSGTKAHSVKVEVVNSSGDLQGTYAQETELFLFDRERVIGTRTYRVVPSGTAPVVEGAQFGTGYTLVWGQSVYTTANAFIFGYKQKTLKSGNILQIIEACPIPPTRYEYPDIPFRFPALWALVDDWEVTTDDPDIPIGPWLGVNYTLEAHRSSNQAGRRKFQYGLGAPIGFPSSFRVATPGAASRYFPIPENCIHSNFSKTINGVVVEYFPASTPATYSKSQVITVRSWSEPWRGIFYESVTEQVSETTDPADFPL